MGARIVIVAETFHQAQCDANGCPTTLPSGDDGFSHLEITALHEALAEESGQFDETWTVTPDGKTYCPRHRPGNIDCTSCRDGYNKVSPPGTTGTDVRYEVCGRCGGRGYLQPVPGAKP